MCTMCGFSCTRKDYLRHHTNFVHADVKPFQCSVCFVEFKQKISLKKHIRDNHDESTKKIDLPKFPCPFCSIFFKGKTSVMKHVELEHPEWIGK